MPLTSANTVPARFDTRNEHCETLPLMTPDTSRGSAPSTAATASARAAKTGARPQVTSAHNDGWLMAVELVTATFTWGGVGYLIDRFWLGTYPVFMSIGFMVGFFAGMYLLWLKTSTAPPVDSAPVQGGADADA